MEFTASQSMPGEVLAAAIPVLIYSFFCLLAGILLISMLIITKEKLSYVFLLAVSTTISTALSIMQQCNNIANFEQGRLDYIEVAQRTVDEPAVALGPLSKGLNSATYLIVYYLYSVDALLIMFWSIALVASVWLWRPRALQPYESMMGLASKAAAFIVPAIFEGLRQIHLSFGATFVLVNFVLLFSLSVSSACIVLILIKYLSSRLGFGGYATGTVPISAGGIRATNNRWTRLSARVDPWLIVRFSIASILLVAFEIFLVSFCVHRYHNALAIAKDPHYTTHESLLDIVNYIPEPTPSLLIFFIFGTTAQLRAHYGEILGPLNCFRGKGLCASPRLHGTSTQEWTRVSSEAMRNQARKNDLEANTSGVYELTETECKRTSIPRVIVTGGSLSFDKERESISSKNSEPIHEIHTQIVGK